MKLEGQIQKFTWPHAQSVHEKTLTISLAGKPRETRNPNPFRRHNLISRRAPLRSAAWRKIFRQEHAKNESSQTHANRESKMERAGAKDSASAWMG
jgi:hypothetical protein